MKEINKEEAKKFKAIFFDFGGTLMCAESDNVAHLHMMKWSPNIILIYLPRK
jgi:2-haloacid dehalogenase/putative hydrolase of the HAD superfamily